MGCVNSKGSSNRASSKRKDRKRLNQSRRRSITGSTTSGDYSCGSAEGSLSASGSLSFSSSQRRHPMNPLSPEGNQKLGDRCHADQDKPRTPKKKGGSKRGVKGNGAEGEILPPVPDPGADTPPPRSPKVKFGEVSISESTQGKFCPPSLEIDIPTPSHLLEQPAKSAMASSLCRHDRQEATVFEDGKGAGASMKTPGSTSHSPLETSQQSQPVSWTELRRVPTLDPSTAQMQNQQRRMLAPRTVTSPRTSVAAPGGLHRLSLASSIGSAASGGGINGGPHSPTAASNRGSRSPSLQRMSIISGASNGAADSNRNSGTFLEGMEPVPLNASANTNSKSLSLSLSGSARPGTPLVNKKLHNDVNYFMNSIS